MFWAYPDEFGDVTLRLCGMHMSYSFIRSVGALMADSWLRLEEF